MKKIILFLLGFMTSLLSFAKQVSNDQFRAGAAETNISPSASLLPFMSQHESYPYVDVHDSLMARVVILEKGRERLVLAEADEVAIPEPAAWVKAVADTVTVPGQHYNANYETGAYTLEAAPDVKIPVTDIRIGPIRIEGVGADLAARIGATLRAQSTVAHTMLITNTAGSVGYVLEDAAYEHPHHGAFGSHVKPGYVLPALIKAFNRFPQISGW